MDLSIIIPVYNSENILDNLINKIHESFNKHPFTKNFDIHSLFIVNDETTTNKGYYIYQNYNKIVSINNNYDTKFYYVDAIKFYKIFNGIFKFSLINELENEYITLVIGENYDSCNNEDEILVLIKKVYLNIDTIIKTFNTKYIDTPLVAPILIIK